MTTSLDLKIVWSNKRYQSIVKNIRWNIQIMSPLNTEYALNLKTFYTDLEICTF